MHFLLSYIFNGIKKGGKIAFFAGANSAATAVHTAQYWIILIFSIMILLYPCSACSRSLLNISSRKIIIIFDAESMASTKTFQNYEFLLFQPVTSKLLMIINNKSFRWLPIEMPKTWFRWISNDKMEMNKFPRIISISIFDDKTRHKFNRWSSTVLNKFYSVLPIFVDYHERIDDHFQTKTGDPFSSHICSIKWIFF